MPVIDLDDCDSFPSMKSPAVCTSLKTGDGLNKSCSAQNTSKLSVDLSHDTSADKSSSDLNDTDYDQDYDFDYSDYDKDKDPSDDDAAAENGKILPSKWKEFVFLSTEQIIRESSSKSQVA